MTATDHSVRSAAANMALLRKARDERGLLARYDGFTATWSVNAMSNISYTVTLTARRRRKDGTIGGGRYEAPIHFHDHTADRALNRAADWLIENYPEVLG